MKKYCLFILMISFCSFAKAGTKTWVGASGGSWTSSGNWSPAGQPGSGDDIVFSNSSNMVVTLDFTNSTSINSLSISGTANVNLTAATVLTINLGGAGSSGTALNIVASRTLSLTASATSGGVIINIPTGYTASINGTLALSAFYSSSSAANSGFKSQTAQLIGTDAGSIVFNSGAACTCNYNLATSPFYSGANTNDNIVVFNSGSKLTYYGGGNIFGAAYPHATVKYQTGSSVVLFGGNAPDMNGRSYPYLYYSNGTTYTCSNTSAGTTSFDSLNVYSGNLTLAGGGTASTTYSIGNISVTANAANTSLGGNGTLTLGSATSGSSTTSYSISGNINVGTLSSSNTSTLNLGENAGAGSNTTNITFSGTNQSLNVGSYGTLTQSDVSGATYKTNYIIAPNAGLTLNKNLSLATANTISTLTIQPSGTLNIGTGVTLTTNGKVTIQSDASGSGSIGNNAGTISGTVTLQKWISAQRAYRVWSNPFTTKQSIKAITDSVLVTGLSTPGTGTFASSNGNPSSFTYNATAAAGSAITPITDATAAIWNYTQPVFVQIRGKGNEGYGLASGQSGDTYTNGGPTDFAIAVSGALNDGAAVTYNLQYSAGANNYNLVGNPYACPINLKLLKSNGAPINTNANIGGTFYVYNPYKGGTGKAVFAGGYDSYSNDGSTDVIVPSMGAFFIQANAAGQTIEFSESVKSSSTSSTTTAAGGVDTTLLNLSQYTNLGTAEIQLHPDSVYTSYALGDPLVTPIPNGYEDKIVSFHLPKGYMVVFAQNSDGTGESACYVAATSSINANLPVRLQNNISYIRYIPINNPNKKGMAYTSDAVVNTMGTQWFYEWSLNKSSFTNQQFVPMTWGKGACTDANNSYLIDRTDIDHLLSFNEPDNSTQSNIPIIDTATTRYAIMQKAGLRIGSPAVQQNHMTGSTNWLPQFMASATQQKLRVDFLTMHWYDWGNETNTGSTDSLTAVGVFNRFVTYVQNVHNTYPGLPLWITEFNANPNRTSATVHQYFMKFATNWLNNSAQSYIERYSYFFPSVLPPVNTDGSLTTLGAYWQSISSPNSFTSNITGDATVF